MKCKARIILTNDWLLAAPSPLKNSIIHELVKEGAPIKILRHSITDCSEFKDSEIEHIALIEQENVPEGLAYSWEKENEL